jgi:ABC-type transport system involved in multi-copper enzyme maturation permease subunit
VKLLEVFRYELEHRLRSPSTWLYAALLFGFALLRVADAAPVGPVNWNAPKDLVGHGVTVALFGLVVSVGIFGDAALRDIEAEMDPLLFTSPLRKIDYLGGRYLAALVTNGILLLVVPLGFALCILMEYPDPALFGPLRIEALLEPWLIFMLPAVALIGAVLFSVAVFSRRVIAVYLSGFVLFMAVAITGDPTFQSTVYDPIASTALARITRGWTAAEQNTRLVGLPAAILWNRLFWLAVTGGVLALLHARFRFVHHDGTGAPLTGPDLPDSAAPSLVAPRGIQVTPSFGFETTVRQTLSIARESLRDVAANVWFVGVLLALVFWAVSVVGGIPGGPFGTSPWPVTMLVTTGLSRDILAATHILVGLYAGELVWKDRNVHVAEIADAAPVTEGTALLGRFLALAAMLAMLIAATMVGGILCQLGNSYYDIEPGLYLRVFGMNFVDVALFAVLAMTIHVAVNHNYVGQIAVLMSTTIPYSGPLLRNYLLVYAGDPGWMYSDMNGFGPFVGPFLWFKLYWAGWAVLVAVVACLLWVRGREPGARSRLRQARARFTGPLRRTAVAALVLTTAAGGFIFYNTNVLNVFDADKKSAALAPAYEQRYAQFQDVSQPTIERARLHVEIYPDDPAVDLSGSFKLVNRTGVPIDSIHVTTDPGLTTRSISFDREATPVVTDGAVGYRIYALARPLAPGDSMQLSFDLGFRQSGFRNSGIRTDVVDNGTHFDRSWLPFVGDRDAMRRDDTVRVETTIGTAADQIAVASGVLRREWMENPSPGSGQAPRRYFHYEMEAPQAFDAAVFSGRYAVHTDRWGDVTLGVYHHPDHDRNLDIFVRSMKASLSYYSTHFGPYASTVLRVVEIPRYRRVARAHPNIVAFSEHNFFARVKERQPDLLFFGTAHEIAHQWWGGQCTYALDAGDRQGFVSEMLANYSAMMVTEKTYGAEAARRLYAFQMERYFTARTSASDEVAILEIENQPYYFKALLAMYLIRDYLGEEAINTALQRFADKHRAGALPNPTARDVYAELRAATPDSLRYLLTDLFETVTVWNVWTERATTEPTGTGEYRVTLDVVAKKMRVNTVGKESEVPMDDWIEIGAFALGKGAGLSESLYLKRHRIRSGKQTISITVPKQPALAGIDPYHKLLERAARDNVVNPIVAPHPTEARRGQDRDRQPARFRGDVATPPVAAHNPVG